MKRILSLIKKNLNIFIENVIYSEKLTCYPEELRKSKIRIFAENFIWLVRFRRANKYYYIMGFDRKNNAQYKQKNISARKCQTMINRKKLQFSKNAKYYDILINDKFIASQYMLSLGFPVPQTIAFINDKSILFPILGKEVPLEALLTDKQILFKDCICKPFTGGQGRGIFHLEVKDGQIFFNSDRIEYQRLSDLFSGAKYVVQERVIQHKKMSELNPHCLNTIRLVTLIDQNVIIPFSAVSRIGIKGNVTDNWHTGGILIRLDIETGCLAKYGFTQPESGGKKYEKHPETGVAFEGYKIPFFDEAIDLATKLHKYFYCIHSMGWDIAITETGPIFIEGNQGWAPLLIEEDFMDKFLKYFN